MLIILCLLVFSLSSCSLLTSNSDSSPSSFDIQTAIAETQQIASTIEAGIAQTIAARITDTASVTITPFQTETPSLTNTPEPTITPTKPVIIYLSPTPTLNLIITLRTKNKCDDPVTVYATGPMSFTFTLQRDEIDQRNIVPGYYVFSDSKGHKWEQGFSTSGTYSWVLCRNK